MTPRERVLAALRHEQPDRVPLDLGGLESSGMTAMAYNALRAHLGMPQGRTQVYDTYQQIARIEDDLLERFEVDTVPLLMEPRQWKPWALPDGSPCEIPEKWNPVAENGGFVVKDASGKVVARMPGGGFYFEPVNPPLAAVTEISQLDEHAEAISSFDWPSFADESYDEMAARAKRLHDDTDLCVVANFMCHLLAAGQILRGFENFMVDLMVQPELAHALLERLTDAYCRRADDYFAAVGDYVQVVLVNDDLGTQGGPMLSPECFREMILPYQRRFFAYMKQAAPETFLLLHSCGSVREFIPDLIDAGVDALNPVQVSAARMDSAELKSEFGDRLTFWGGGCDTQRVLNSGTPAQVAEEVKRRVGDLAPGGGFVFCQVHNIQADVPPENVVAMFDAFRECR